MTAVGAVHDDIVYEGAIAVISDHPGKANQLVVVPDAQGEMAAIQHLLYIQRAALVAQPVCLNSLTSCSGLIGSVNEKIYLVAMVCPSRCRR